MGSKYKVLQDPKLPEQDGTYRDLAKRFRVDVADLARANGATSADDRPAHDQEIDLVEDLNALYTWIEVDVAAFGGLYHVYEKHVTGNRAAWARNVRAYKPRDWVDLWTLYGNRDYRRWQLEHHRTRDQALGGGPSVWVPLPNQEALRPMPPIRAAPSPAATNVVATPIPEIDDLEQDISLLEFLAARVDALMKDAETAMRRRMAFKCTAFAIRDLVEICAHQSQPGLGRNGYVDEDVVADASTLAAAAEKAFNETKLEDLKREMPRSMRAHAWAWLPICSDIAGELKSVYEAIDKALFKAGASLTRLWTCLQHVRACKMTRDPRFVGVFVRYLEAAAAASIALGEAHKGKAEAEAILSLIAKTPPEGLLDGALPEGKSVAELLLATQGQSRAAMVSLVTTVYGNTKAPMSLSIALAQTAAGWALPQVIGSRSSVVTEKLADQLKAVVLAVTRGSELRPKLDAAFAEKDQIRLFKLRNEFTAHVGNTTQTSTAAKTGYGLFQILGLLMAIDSVSNTPAPAEMKIVDYFNLGVSYASAVNSGVQTFYTGFEIWHQVFGTLDKYAEGLARVGLLCGRISCVLGIISGVITLITAPKDSIVLRLSAAASIAGNVVILAALAASTPSPPTMAIGLALVAIGTVLAVVDMLTDEEKRLFDVNRTFVALLKNVAASEMFDQMKSKDPSVEATHARLMAYFKNRDNNVPQLRRDVWDIDKLRRDGFSLREINGLFKPTFDHPVLFGPSFATIGP